MINLNALFKVTYGMYIVTSGNGEKGNGFVSNSVFQVTAEPMQFAACCNKNNFTADIIKKHKSFGISVLKQEADSKLIGAFGYKSGENINKLKGRTFKTGSTGIPIITEDCIAFFECKLVDTIDVDTHYVFIGELIASDVLTEEDPLTYAYYREVKKGVAPKNAPTYIDKKKLTKQTEENSDKYKCVICGHIYDPAIGDPDSDIPPGTKFEDLPSDWSCPVCGAVKDDFEKM